MSDQPKALPVVHLEQDSFRIDAAAFKSVLNKVGNLPFTIISINGSTRTGKSYILNHFIRYFEAKKRDPNCRNWYNSSTSSSFVWRSGRERETVGINLWSEPYYVNLPEGGKLAVLLLDTQGLFDEQTTARQNAVIFSISTLCSSVMMFNIMRLIDDNILQQVELFAGYAHMASAYQTQNQNQNLAQENANYVNGSKLLFLVRDFGLPAYEYGLHSEDEMPPESSKNYYRDTFHLTDSCPEENKIVRQNIQRNFRDVSVYCLPDPGRNFIRQRGNDVTPDEEFQEGVVAFVEKMVEPKNLVKKTVLGQPTTGLEFRQYIDAWAELCANTKDIFPDVLTMADSTAFTQYSIAINLAISKYKNEMDEFVKKHRGSATPSQLEAAHERFAAAAKKMYDGHHKMPHAKFEKEYPLKLKTDLEYCYEIAKKDNEMFREATTIAGQNEALLLDMIREMQVHMEHERVRLEGIIRGFTDTNQILLRRTEALTEELKNARRPPPLCVIS